VIEQAKGILAHALGTSTDEAFTILRKAARARRTKLRDVAATIAAAPVEAEATLEPTGRDSA
jgi:AmiR/NasT family two-component response regulator